MIISKFGKSYDTSDGSEQHHAAPTGRLQRVAPNGVQDERNPPADEPREKPKTDGSHLLVQPPISPLELSSKPTWSVLSLRDLNEAIRLRDWPDNPANLLRAEENAERNKVQAGELESMRIAARALADRDRYRNAWENT